MKTYNLIFETKLVKNGNIIPIPSNSKKEAIKDKK